MDLTGKADTQPDQPQTEEKLWDRLLNETAKAYRAFCLYRDAQAERTFEAVARELHCSGANIRRWAGRWNWAERVRAFDIYLDKIERDALVRERLNMKKRMARDGVQMQVVAAAALTELQRLLTDKDSAVRLTASDIARLAEVGGKLERYARGEEEGNLGTLEIRVHVDDPPAESAEDLTAAKAAIEDALRGR